MNSIKRLIASLLIVPFLTAMTPFALATEVTPWMLPAGTMVQLSAKFEPALVVGIQLDAKDPFRFNFLIERGQKELTTDAKREEYRKLVKYFLASLTIPNDDMWVNLSPYEHERIISDNFGLTEMGRDLLAQDYLLKQITSSLIHPDDGAAKGFWKKVYEKAYEKYGTTDIPLDTFNKVWIVPDTATIFHRYDTALIVENHLKVMMEQDYLALEKNEGRKQPDASQKRPTSETAQLAAEVVREIVIPMLEKEVNEGEHFAPLRQVYSAMLMATWFKKSLKESVLGQVYADRSKVAGVELNNPKEKEEIYQKYLKAYKVGVFNFIKEDLDPLKQEVIPRKYFSGGTKAHDPNKVKEVVAVADLTPVQRKNAAQVAEQGIDRAVVEFNASQPSEALTEIRKNDLSEDHEQNQSKELTTIEHFKKSKLYLKLATGMIPPSQYYKDLQRIVRPEVQVALDLGQERGALAVKLFKHLSEETGIDFVPLLVEPGVSSRAEEFTVFVRTNLQGHPSRLGADELRDHFAAHLEQMKLVKHPQGKMYFRGLRLMEQEKDRIVNRGLNAKVTDGVLRRYTLQDIEGFETGKDEQEMKRELETDFDNDRGIGNALLWDMESLGSLRVDIELRLKPESVPFCVSQSITEIEQLAKDITMVHGVWDNKRAGDSAYVFTLNVPEIYVINGNALVNKGKPTAFITSDGKEYNFPAPEVESFVQVPIQAEWIKKVDGYAETGKTFREKGQEQGDGGQFFGQANLLKTPRIKRVKDLPDFLKMSFSNLVSMSINASAPGHPEDGSKDDASKSNQWQQGGIDLNAGLLNMKIKRDGAGMPLPLPMQDPVLMHIEGLSPTIFEIAPANAMPIFSEIKANSPNQAS